MKVRTRIAPSPTGQLHIGHIRTSLYDYAFAKKHNGRFILRVEDTDRQRYVSGAVEKVLDLHEYMGLVPDEGPRSGGKFGPYVQSERLETYNRFAQELIEKKHAYYCFCDEKRLLEIKEAQRQEGISATKYDKSCSNLTPEEVKEKLNSNTEHVIRLNVPKNINITWQDKVYGEITVSSNDLDDQVLIKSDGYPTYHMAVVVDDHLMEITHVFRGNDWIPSTPKHILLYKYLGWEPPVYIHLPNLKEVDGAKKLSKRFGAVSVEEFLSEGYMPEALLNHMMFLGWNPGTEKEIYSLEEFINDFDIRKIQKTDLVSFDRDKLLWFNGAYIRNLEPVSLYEKILYWSKKWNKSTSLNGKDDKYDIKVISLIQERLKVFSEAEMLVKYFYADPEVDHNLLTSYAADEKRAAEILLNFLTTYREVRDSEWKADDLDKLSHELLEKFGYKPKEAFMTIRVAVSGSKFTPPLFDILETLGKEISTERINKALKMVSG